jgi:hypothetical protein
VILVLKRHFFRFEYCFWKHRGRVCEFEWKRSHSAVIKQTCLDLHRRVNFIGNYDAHECEIELLDVTELDSGEWTCELESYVWGDVESGEKDSDTLQLVVIPKSTTITSTSASTSTTTSNDRTSKKLFFNVLVKKGYTVASFFGE